MVTDTGGSIRDAVVNGDDRRSFHTVLGKQTFDGTRRLCYYASSMDTSVIEGTYTDYKTKSLFATNYIYMQFDGYRCNF